MIARNSGESVRQILVYWLPEVISSALLISLPILFDNYLVASLKSTSTYGALGVATSFLHTISKFAEALPVAAIAIIGRHNGAREYGRCGHDLGDVFWTSMLVGTLQFLIVFWYAEPIYRWLGGTEKMIAIGVPFLRLRSISVLLIFIFWSFVGFMKGVKNTKVPMYTNILGIITFMICDYLFVPGSFGFPRLGLTGSALASVVQYLVMVVAALSFLFYHTDFSRYMVTAFYRFFSVSGALTLVQLSWPIIIDKGALAFSYVWLAKMINPMGKYAISSYSVINNLERSALIPAIAFAQVVTFLVSNRLGAQDSTGAKTNVKKVMLLTAVITCVALIVLCANARWFVSAFDQKGKFTDFAAFVLPIVSLFVVFDFIQLILAGALRGAGDVRSVMWIRFLTCIGFFVPVSFICARLLPIENQMFRFTLIYSTFYLNTAVMGLIFLMRIRGRSWQAIKL